MSQRLLDEVNRSTVVQCMRGMGMAQPVRRNRLIQSGTPRSRTNNTPDLLPGERTAPARAKHRILAGPVACGLLRCPMVLYGGPGIGGEEYCARFLTFTEECDLSDRLPFFHAAIHQCTPIKVCKLRNPSTRSVEYAQKHAVAVVGFQCQNAFNGPFCQDSFVQPVGNRRQGDRSTHIEFQVSDLVTKAEQALNRRKLTCSGIWSQPAREKVVGPLPEVLQTDVAEGQIHIVDELVSIPLVRRLRVRALAAEPEVNQMQIIIGLGNSDGLSAMWGQTLHVFAGW